MPSCRRLTTCRMGFAGATPTLEMHLRSRRGVGVRYWAQANARGSSGVRGMAQTRKCRVWCGRAPAGPIVAQTAAKRLAIVLFTDLGDNREGTSSRFWICYSAQRELFNGVLNVS